MYRSYSLLLLALALLTLSIPSGATVIYVSGDQTGTWSADTVIVTAEVCVPPGQSLTILSGVEVLFSVYCKLIVDNGATLRAVGTAVDSILFDVLPPNVNWHGIRFLFASDSSKLEYCALRNGWAYSGVWDSFGGAIFCYYSSPIIDHNTISENSAAYGGGIGCCYSYPNIRNNVIHENSAVYGGGIVCSQSNPAISSNLICDNSADCGGGILSMAESAPWISGNTIRGNLAFDFGGGVDCNQSNPILVGNTLVENTALLSGGGIRCYYSSASIINCIIWTNMAQQIALEGTSYPRVTYCDLDGGWPGTGNLNTYPAFVDTAQDDYRLQWGSPCIDSGDPNPFYNDPDLTRADMGAFYYDQSMPVRILLTPYNAPIQIPAGGGSFQFALHVTNSDNVAHSTTAWCNVTLPSGNISSPLLGPVTVPLGAGQTLSRLRTQVVPANAPAGMYHYNAYAVAAGDTSVDSFTFVKLGFRIQSASGGSGFGGWANTGENFDELQGVQLNAPTPPMIADLCVTVSPNPANPKTAISYKLQAASFVNLSVYDISGKKIAELVNGWRDAGDQQVTFDGSALASGVYLYRLEAGEATAVGKLVLVK